MLWDIGEAAKKEVRDRIAKHNINCDYAPGIIHAELRKKSLSGCMAEVSQLKSDHAYDEIEYLDQTSIQSILGTDKYVGGSLDMGAGHLHPLKFGIGLARAAQESGVKIFEESRVRKIEKGTIVKIETENKRIIRANFLCLAAMAT